MKALALILVSLCLVGCESLTNLRSIEPFRQSFDNPLTLQRDAIIYYSAGYFLHDKDSEHLELGSQFYKKHRHVVLPKGTPLTLDKAQLHIGYDSIYSYTAWGRIQSPEDDRPIRFSYLWGWFDTIERAPWEDASVPGGRYVGPDGKEYSGALGRIPASFPVVDPLHYAAQNDLVSIAELLIAQGRDIKSTAHDVSITPICRARSSEMVALLVAAGANVNARDSYGATPLHWMVRDHRKESVIKFIILSGADVNAKTNDGMTPLDFAHLHRSSPTVISTLVLHGAQTGGR